MLDVEQVRQRIIDAIPLPRYTETVPLTRALGRVLASDIVSPMAVPPFDNSAMDGFAVKLGDVIESTTEPLMISQRIPAGCSPPPLQPGTAARIFTGGVIPEGADTVIIQENCEYQSGAGTVKVMETESLSRGANIRRSGEDIESGTQLFYNGCTLRPQDIGLLASVGHHHISVYRKPQVALISTGDELVDATSGKKLTPGEIYNSNQPMLQTLLQQMGCEVITFATARDSKAEVIKTLEEATSNADIVITTGGVSVGEEDHVKSAVESLGSIDLWKVRLKPGKPLAFGRIGGAAFFGLPGNPVSSFVTFALFVAPAIRKLRGSLSLFPDAHTFLADFERLQPGNRAEYLRIKQMDHKVVPHTNQSSGALSSVAWADGLAFLPANKIIRKGEEVQVYLIQELTI